jgi:opacity protein-like surface antigen
MKKVVAIAVLFVMALSSVCFADTYVRGHVRNDGTYVQDHYRSDRDGDSSNNWSHQGNVNPYTGARGDRW